MKSVLAVSFALVASASAYVKGVNPLKPPHQSEPGQYGYNDCGTKDSPKSKCQSLWINSPTDFCLFSSPTKNQPVGNIERIAVAYCTKAGHGARLMPAGTLESLHYVRTPHYTQITGKGDFTKLNLPKGDEGGELDPHGYDGKGNPIGALVFGMLKKKAVQYADWTQFIAADEFCIRVCNEGPNARRYCGHVYDVMGCDWNMPGNYGGGFDQCEGDDIKYPMGEYPKDGKTSTFSQGMKSTPAGQKPAKTSQCKTVASPPAAKYPKNKRAEATPVANLN